MQFKDLGLIAPLLQALHELGHTTPTPIQVKGIPAVLAGRDLIAAAQTGTGKTGSFALPLLQKLGELPPPEPNSISALVLTPTRELAQQVADDLRDYGRRLPVRVLCCSRPPSRTPCARWRPGCCTIRSRSTPARATPPWRA